MSYLVSDLNAEAGDAGVRARRNQQVDALDPQYFQLSSFAIIHVLGSPITATWSDD